MIQYYQWKNLHIWIERRKIVNPSIDIFINSFAMRGITSREQLLNEMLRVKLTARVVKSQKNLCKMEASFSN